MRAHKNYGMEFTEKLKISMYKQSIVNTRKDNKNLKILWRKLRFKVEIL